MRRLFFAFFVAALLVAVASTYQVQVYQEASLGGQLLKPGAYKLTLNDAQDRMTITQGNKLKLEVPVTVVEEKGKFSTTQMRVVDENGKPTIREIRLGGSNRRVTVQ
jgi:hypothetical protein